MLRLWNESEVCLHMVLGKIGQNLICKHKDIEGVLQDITSELKPLAKLNG